jgi:hypothetical protein
MMQMLHQGGIPAMTDEIRAADTDNPRGYFELERVKQTKLDPSWVPEARGKAVKMVSSLLHDLPGNERYRIIFMRRDMDEILESQDKMLRRLGGPITPHDKLRSAFETHLERLAEWLPTRSDMRVLEVSYNSLLNNPQTEVDKIVRFLDGAPSATRMLESIDPALYRNRRAS